MSDTTVKPEEIKSALDGIAKGVEEYKSELDNVKKELSDLKTIGIISRSKSDTLMDEKVKFFKDVMTRKYVGTGSDATGGYVIPAEIANTLLDTTNAAGLVRPGASVFPMNTDELNVPEIDALTASYVAPGSAITGQDINLTNYQLLTKPISVLLPIDNSWLQDVNPQVVAKIEEMALKAFAFREDYCSLVGSGTANAANAGVSGVTTVCPTGNVVTLSTTGIATTGFTADTLADMISKPTGRIDNGEFFFDRSVRALIRKFQHNSQYIFTPAGNGDVDRIWGYKVNWLPSGILMGTGSVTADTAFGIFGDPRYILIGNRNQISIQMSEHAGFAYNQTYLRFIKRQAIAVVGKGFGIVKTKA